VDDKNVSQSIGKPLSYREITTTIVNNCVELSCTIQKDTSSKETNITYQDKMGKKHTVWFEDLASVSEKKAYLKTKGIHNFSYWAYSYF
jgi:spore germination protein YaaH